MRRFLICLLVLGGAVGCDRSAPPEPYTNTFASEAEAAQAVADALRARDAARLQALAVSAAEFRKNIWPKLPASKPEVGMPVDYVWQDTSTRSLAGLAETLREYGGRTLTVEAVTFGGETTDYGEFKVHRKARLKLRDDVGDRQDARLFGSMIHTPAGWKVFSYIVD